MFLEIIEAVIWNQRKTDLSQNFNSKFLRKFSKLS